MKQSEFLEIIEQNKGKHRQPIEVLVQGRKNQLFDSEKPVETRLVAKFDIITTSSSTTILYTTQKFSEIEIDGIVQPSVVTNYQFDTLGEHTVKYTLTDSTIGNNSFQYCNRLTNIIIPNNVTSIGERTFLYCSSLTNVIIGNNVTSIGYSAFGNCQSLTSIIIPNSVTTIGDFAFDDCINLANVAIGSGVTSIGERSFYSSNERTLSLTNITVDPNNTTYDSRDNSNAIIETATNKLIQGSNNTVIPNTVTSIGNYAFYACTTLSSLLIPNSVTSIGNYVFGNCSSLTSVNIPDGVTSIGSYTFGSCSKLTNITVPNSVTYIDYQAFAMCVKLESIIIGSGVTRIDSWAFYRCTILNNITSLATTAPTIQSNTFQDVKANGTLTVPSGSSGYDVWMDTSNYYLGKYNWTKVEQ